MDLNLSAAYEELKKPVCYSLSKRKDRIFKNNHMGEIKLDELVLIYSNQSWLNLSAYLQYRPIFIIKMNEITVL